MSIGCDFLWLVLLVPPRFIGILKSCSCSCRSWNKNNRSTTILFNLKKVVLFLGSVPFAQLGKRSIRATKSDRVRPSMGNTTGLPMFCGGKVMKTCHQTLDVGTLLDKPLRS